MPHFTVKLHPVDEGTTVSSRKVRTVKLDAVNVTTAMRLAEQHAFSETGKNWISETPISDDEAADRQKEIDRAHLKVVTKSEYIVWLLSGDNGTVDAARVWANSYAEARLIALHRAGCWAVTSIYELAPSSPAVPPADRRIAADR
jgi:hypothetical protein